MMKKIIIIGLVAVKLMKNMMMGALQESADTYPHATACPKDNGMKMDISLVLAGLYGTMAHTISAGFMKTR